MIEKPYWKDMTVRSVQKHLGGNLFHGDTRTFTPTLWKYLIDRFGVKSMLDVGSGEGHAPLFFHRNGVVAIGIEGLKSNLESSVYPLVWHDVTTAPFYMPVDLTLCVEVVEHIEEKYIDSLSDTLCNGNIIVMTHALPNQTGHHHVNCKPQSYWINLIESRGFRLISDLEHFKKIAKNDVANSYFEKSGLIFVRKPLP